MSGKRLTFSPIYGYKRDPSYKDKWIIDDGVSADVVRRIFQMTIDGKGPVQIARILAEEKIERPTYYLTTRGIVDYGYFDMSDPYRWAGGSVAHIIERPEYCGDTVNFRSYKESYKDKKVKFAAPEDWVIFEDTHPGIVSRETWETAQKCRKTIRRTDTLGEANPLTGLVFCHECGAKMYNPRQPYPKTYVDKRGYTCTRYGKDIYACSTYNLSLRKYNPQCTQHNIRTEVLRIAALEAIRAASAAVQNNEAEFVAKLREESAVRKGKTAKAHKQRIAQGNRRIAELDKLIKRIYEDNVAGKLSDKRFNALSEEYEQEQSELEQTISQLQEELDAFNADNDRTERFIEIVHKYTDLTELTAPMIAEFLDSIEVYEADKSSGERTQKVDVYLNYIGKFCAPEAEKTPLEIANEEAARTKRKRCAEAQRRYYWRKKEREELSAQMTAQ